MTGNKTFKEGEIGKHEMKKMSYFKTVKLSGIYHVNQIVRYLSHTASGQVFFM